jgi:zinc transporter, ZIP family
MLAVVLSLTALFPRWLGGLVALRQRDRFHLVLGFAAGALLGVAAFETMPEAFELLGDEGIPGAAAVGIVLIGAGAFAVIERPAFGHMHREDRACNPMAGHVGAGGITTHAFLDGLAIGAAFQVNEKVGFVVASAVLLHAFADGLNTVTVVLRHGHSRRKAVLWLGADALAPIVGALTALIVSVPDAVLGGVLAFFAGMFVYLGAGSLLPAAHASSRDTSVVGLATASGFLLLLGVSRLVGE